MQLELRNVCKKVGNQYHINDISLTLEAGTLNILLGPTLSGKTSLMRLMAGLDKPTSGSILVNGKDVAGIPVQKRNVAMVYQQFINYPNLTVYENIASPMRLAGIGKKEIDEKVQEYAELLKLTPMLQRSPQELSGGQQQRTALARALVKNAELVLLDEPLANLDYKLREELREEFPRIFAATGSIFVYATTEPSEALLLGGLTAPLHHGCVTQFGPTLEVFRKPQNLITAKTFSDPPPNLLPVQKADGVLSFKNEFSIPADGKLATLADGNYTIAFRPHRLSINPNEKAIKVDAQVVITEITGSESFIHVNVAGLRWVALVPGIHNFDVEESVQMFLDPLAFYIFDEKENLVIHPDSKRLE